MKLVLILLAFLFSSERTFPQQLTAVDLEKLLHLSLAEADDYLQHKGFQYLGDDTKSPVFEGGRTIQFGRRDPFRLIAMISYFKNKSTPNMVGYFCSEIELRAKKKYYLDNGY